MTSTYLESLTESDLQKTLLRCCAARRWVTEMVQRRPFANDDGVVQSAEEIWWSLGEEDWREAFAAHPKIGDINTLRTRFQNTSQWASSEQAGTQFASDETLQQLAAANSAYEARFGYIFIVCATGKSGLEMSEILRNRLKNAPDEEVRVAAAEQLKITQLRLRKLES